MVLTAIAASTQDASAWIVVISWIVIGSAVLSAGLIAVDIFLRGNRQHMAVMNAVYPLNASHWGPPMLWFYWRYGRHDSQGSPWWSQVAKSNNHCGAGCWLGDIVGAWIVFVSGWTIAGSHLWTEYILELALAFTFGIAFQYFAIAPMRNESAAASMRDALKADTLSILAFQVGMFGWMAIYHLTFWDPPIAITTPVFWFMMMIGMALGFVTAYPVNAWLINRGVKEAM